MKFGYLLSRFLIFQVKKIHIFQKFCGPSGMNNVWIQIKYTDFI